MPVDLIIRNGSVVRDSGVERADIAIENESIVEIAPSISDSARAEIDATNLHVFPGLIDPHVHFNEPGRTDWEGFDTGSAALSAGGGTMFFDMPLNSSPPVLDGESFDAKLAAGLKNSRTDFALWGGLTPTNLDKMEALADRGVVGFKAFMSNSGISDFERADDKTLARGLRTAARLGLIVAVHAESEELTAQLSAECEREHRTSWKDYLDSRPISAEVEAIERAIALAGKAGCALHIVHVSTAAGVDVVRSAAERGLHVSCETCPHYLLLTGEDLERIGARAKCAPPVRDREETRRMWAKLREGSILFVGSDHSPAPESMKTDDDCFKIWGGIAGVQSTLPAMLSDDLDLQLVARLTAGAVARRFGIEKKGSIETGSDADFALVRVDDRYTLSREMLLDRHKLSPYVGREFRGRVVRTILRGRAIFLDGETVGEPGGRFVRPTRS